MNNERAQNEEQCPVVIDGDNAQRRGRGVVGDGDIAAILRLGVIERERRNIQNPKAVPMDGDGQCIGSVIAMTLSHRQ